MRSFLSRFFWPFVLPVLSVLAGCRLQRMAGELSQEWQELVLLAPYAIVLAGLLLSLRFNRSCAFFCLLIVGVIYTALGPMLPSKGEALFIRTLFAALCTVVPLNLVVLCLMPERGILTSQGFLRFAFILAQAAILSFALMAGSDRFLPLLPSGFKIPAYAHAVMAFCTMVMVTKLVFRPSAIDSGVLGALLVLAIASNRIHDPFAFPVHAGMAGIAIAFSIIQRSHDMAYRDELTKLPGRRALEEALMELGRCYVIAMVDVDHFKRFNDRYGHSAGDDVLRLVASRIRGTGGGGRAYRYGGEEFAIIFRRRTIKGVLPYLEDLRQTISGYRLTIRRADRPRGRRKGRRLRSKDVEHQGLSITVSIGVAERNDRYGTPDEVLDAADKALYRAKRKGRNRVSR